MRTRRSFRSSRGPGFAVASIAVAMALAAHSSSAHMAEFRPKMGGWGVTGADIKKYEIASEGPLR
jgi:hypothetical protein